MPSYIRIEPRRRGLRVIAIGVTVLSLVAYAATQLLGGTGSDPGTGSATTATGGAPASTGLITTATYGAITPQQAALARWSAPINLPVIPVGAGVLANGKVVMWAGNLPNNFVDGGGNTYTALFNPDTGQATMRNVVGTAKSMFCPGLSRLPDGRMLLNGGHDPAQSTIYDPVNDSWQATSAVNLPRGYPGSVTLGDGSVLTLGGGWGVDTAAPRAAEIFTVAGGWRLLPGLPDSTDFMLDGTFKSWPSNSHYYLFPTANGKVLLAGPTPNMAWLDPQGNGSFAPAGRRGDDGPAFQASMAMYEAGKILKVGGAAWNSDAPSSASAYLIDTTNGSADVQKLAPMAYARTYSNSVVLPNGQVLVVGGQTYAKEFSDTNAVLAPELFDPVTQRFTLLPPMRVARNYHSVGLLLLDGRVFVGGGGLCACAGDHADAEIFSPPYLFNPDGSAATRPVIQAAPDRVAYGSTVAVQTDTAIAGFAMVRLGATTHSVNTGQRRVSVTFASSDPTHHLLNIPSNPGVLLPGQWMLFALNANGTPSMAKVITVDNTGAPVLPAQPYVSAVTGATLNAPFKLGAVSGTLSFTASGLPDGLRIDPATGAISGAAMVPGRYVVTVQASNGTQTVSVDRVIEVTTLGSGSGLRAQYFNNTTLSGAPAAEAVEAINYDWGTNAPRAGVNADGFSARWTGSIESPNSGALQLQSVSDDGVRVWVNNQLVIDNWTLHGATADTVAINVVGGQRNAIMIEYFEQGGGATMQLQWRLPNATGFVPVPADRLYAATPLVVSNLALGKATSQSSNYAGTSPARAVDGDTNGAWGGGSVTHTNATAPQDWWQVDLGRLSRIDLVQLWNRTDCCADRLQNFYVLVSPTDMTGRTLNELLSDPKILQRKVGATTAVTNLGVPIGGLGRYVRVQLIGQQNLSLAEVQVWGGPGEYHTPTINAVAAQTNVVGGNVNLPMVATDPDGNPLSFSATGLPPGVSIAPATGVIQGVPSLAGTYTVTVKAANEGALSASTTFALTVLDVVPAVNGLAAPAGSAGGSIAYNPNMGAGASAQYSWNFGDGTGDTPFAATAGNAHVFAAPGVYPVALTVLTADGRSAVYRFLQAVTSPGLTQAQVASSNLLLEPRSGASTRLWVVNPDNDSVSVFDAASQAKLAEIPVGAAPRTLARARDGRIWVVNQDAASISVIQPGTLSVAQTIALPRGSQPYGVLVSPTDGSVFVTLEALGRVLKLDGVSGATVAARDVGPQVRHLGMNAQGSTLLVSRFITRPLPGEGSANVRTTDAQGNPVGAEVLSLDPNALTLVRTVVLAHSERIDGASSGRGIPNYLGAPVISPDGRSAWVPSKQDNIKRGPLRDGNPLEFKHTVRAVASRIDLGTLQEALNDRLDFNLASVASAAVFHPQGAYLFVALETNRQVAVVDVAGKQELFRLEVGLAPQGLQVSPDGLRLYVSNFMGRSVTVLDLAPLVNAGQVALPTVATLNTVGTERLPANVLKGKQLFYDARDPRLARDSYMSCASCHNDGRQDGRVWDLTAQGEGLRRTIALKGRAGMGQGFLHWSANFDEVQDFEAQIRNLAGGTGLMSDADFNLGTRKAPLGDKKAGISPDLDALAAYVGSLSVFAPSPLRNLDGTLSAAGLAGQAVFKAMNCAKCHGGSAFTFSGDATQLKDIGTLKATSGARLGGALTGIDVPTLRDVWSASAYLHDGSAPTLTDAVLAHNAASLGGTLAAADLPNLVAYLQQIGGDEATAPVQQVVGPVFGKVSAGTPFTDPVTPNQRLTGVIVRSGWWVDAIQGITATGNLPAHGGAGGGVANVSWPSTEFLVRIYGKVGSGGVISTIAFVTNTGRVMGPYATGWGQDPTTSYDYTVPAGNRVIGFTGSSSGYLNAIGVIYAPQ